MQRYTKAIAAFLTSAVALAVVLGAPEGFVSSEAVLAVATVVGTALVYLLPNRE